MGKIPPHHVLVRLDHRPIPEDALELRAFVPVRNEAARLPWFLEHHRHLGVDRFFIIDNGSDDGTIELLLAATDCHVFRTRASFSEALHGVAWVNSLLDQYGAGRWCLSLDADELFVYPGCEEAGLRTLIRFLDQEGAQGVFAFLLDMYGAGPVANTIYVPGTPFLEACPYFDSNYRWRFAPKRCVWPGAPSPFPPMDVLGGPRLRCLHPDFATVGPVRRHLQRLSRLAAILCGRTPLRPPFLPKIPFVHWKGNLRYISNHTTTPIQLSSVTGALLHFKFFSDFQDRVITEVRRREHFAAAAEYTRYLAWLEQPGGGCLHDLKSVRYRDTDQLVNLGLLRDPIDWRSFMRLWSDDAIQRRLTNP